jgi:hypothetical protein
LATEKWDFLASHASNLKKFDTQLPSLYRIQDETQPWPRQKAPQSGGADAVRLAYFLPYAAS